MRRDQFLYYSGSHILGLLMCNWISELYFGVLHVVLFAVILLSIIAVLFKQARASLLLLFFCFGWFQISLSQNEYSSSDAIKINNSKIRIEKIKESEAGMSLYGQIASSPEQLSLQNKKVYLFIKGENTPLPIVEGNVLTIKNLSLKSVISKKTLYDFDFDTFLLKQNIRWKAYVRRSQIDSITKERHIIMSNFRTLQSRWKKQYEANFTEANALAIITALSLGDKALINEDLRSIFSTTGAMHVLAVSGLHVGIIYLIIHFIFSNLPLGRKFKSYFGPLLSILCIWSFAFLTGGSPSTIRASFMISIVILGHIIHRRSQILNALGFTAFVLLCINPWMIYQLSFQFSFVALLSIIIFQPILESFYLPKSKLLQYFFKLFYLSFAAQALTLPLVVYYFHQIPVYFFLSGIIAVPLAGFLLTLLFCWLLWFELFGLVLSPLSYLIKLGTKLMYQSLLFIQELPYSSIHVEFISLASLTAYYASVICLLGILFKVKKQAWITLLLCIAILSSGFHLTEQYGRVQQKYWIISSIEGRSNYCLILGTTAFIHPSTESGKWAKKMKNISKHYHINKIKQMTCDQLEIHLLKISPSYFHKDDLCSNNKYLIQDSVSKFHRNTDRTIDLSNGRQNH